MKTEGDLLINELNCNCSNNAVCSNSPLYNANNIVAKKKKLSIHKSLFNFLIDKKENVALILSLMFFSAGFLILSSASAAAVLFISSYVVAGEKVLRLTLKNLASRHTEIFDENMLMSIATIGALAIGEFPEAAAVMIFYRIGLYFQHLAVDKAKRSISSLLNIRPDYANLLVGDQVFKVAPEKASVGDVIVVKPGEKIPLDATILEGISTLDNSTLTGESLPVEVSKGSEVLSGSVNRQGLLTLKVTKPYSESTVSKILNLVQNAITKKSRTEHFIAKFARIYTPVVIISAVFLAFAPPFLIPEASFEVWFHRALIFLVVSCPCALVLSIPLSYFAGIGGASRSGIMIKGANYLEALSNVDTVVFDKTGTLTKGSFFVTHIEALNGYTAESLLFYAAHAESQSNHPIAKSIVKTYGKEVDFQKIKGVEEFPGQGISAEVDGRRVHLGNSVMLESNGIKPESKDFSFGTVVHIVIDDIHSGYFVISDELRADSIRTVSGLKKLGVRHIAMLTGDSRAASENIMQKLGNVEAHFGLLPDQKAELLEKYLKQSKKLNGKLVFAGDGINDAPSLALSDIGMAMGGIGSDAAVEAADVVLMTDEPSKIVTAILFAQKTHRIVWQNIILTISVEVIVLTLGALGIATMWMAVFSDVGVAILAVFNALRAMWVRR